MRRFIVAATAGAFGLGLLAPAASADWYRYCGRWRPYHHRRVIIERGGGGPWDFLLGAAVGAGVGILVDRARREDREEREEVRKRDREVNRRPEGDPGRGRESEPERQTISTGPQGSPVRLPAVGGELRVEPLQGGRVKVAWLGEEQGLRHVELFTARRDRSVLARERVYEFPYAATFDEPERGGFLGVTLVYRTGESVTRMVPRGAPASEG